MSKTDDIFWRQFGIILGLLVLFGFVVAFIARSIAGDAFDRQVNSPSAVAERIAPVGSVRVGDPEEVVAAAPAPTLAAAGDSADASAGGSEGQSVYSGVCQACHVAGVAGAPKLDDAEAWAPRIELGEDALVASVLDGKGAMPPKGGNAALSEEQIRAAVSYMVAQISGEQSSAQDKPADAAQQATHAAGDAAGKASETAGDAAEKVKQAAGDAAEKAKQATGDAAATAGAMAAGAAESKQTADAASPASAGKPGDEVYGSACVACHVTGVANAPKLTDKAAWEARAATGFDALLQSVLNGKGAMPPKGGATALEQADIENAIRYMLEQAGVSAK